MLMKLSLGKGFYRHVRHLLSELAYATSRGFQRIYIVIRYICNGRDELLLVRSVVAAAASSIGRAGARPYRGPLAMAFWPLIINWSRLGLESGILRSVQSRNFNRAKV